MHRNEAARELYGDRPTDNFHLCALDTSNPRSPLYVDRGRFQIRRKEALDSQPRELVTTLADQHRLTQVAVSVCIILPRDGGQPRLFGPDIGSFGFGHQTFSAHSLNEAANRDVVLVDVPQK